MTLNYNELTQQKPIVWIKLNDEVNCTITGLRPNDKEYLWRQFGYKAKDYYFNPKFNLGSWDGYIRFFTKHGKTYVHLLDQIIPIISKNGYKIKVQDNRKSAVVFPDPINEDFFSGVIDKFGKPWKMRDYQIEAVNTLLDEGNGIMIAGTGGGKTAMTAALALSYERKANLKSIIIVPDKNLTAQTYKEYANFGLDVGEYSGERKDPDHMHVVSTWQSLKNMPSLLKQFQVLVVDETHGAKANELKKLLVEHGKTIVHRFGVTGTLPDHKSDATTVIVGIGPVRYEVPASRLIDDGYLAKLQINIMQMKVELHEEYDEYLKENEDEPDILTYPQFLTAFFPDWPSERGFLQTETRRTNWIVDYIEALSSKEKGNVLCLVNGINYGKKLSKLIPGSVFIHGKDNMAVRSEAYERFNTEDNFVLIATSQIASTGLDIPRIFNLVFIDQGKSFIKTIQGIGRGLRLAHDKESVHVTDICATTKYSKSHLAKRVKYYKSAKYPHRKHSIEYCR